MTHRDVFVSSSQRDHELAFEVVARVESHGIAWVAPRDIAPAADWAAEIINAIATGRVMVLLFSASANASPQVRREVERAVHKRVRVLTFRVENVLPSDAPGIFSKHPILTRRVSSAKRATLRKVVYSVERDFGGQSRQCTGAGGAYTIVRTRDFGAALYKRAFWRRGTPAS